MLQTNQFLQKEQADLYAIERKLVKALPIIQEALNSLKVEELHLKSQTMQKPMSTQQGASNFNMDIGSFSSTQSTATPNEQINRQQIDLGLFVNTKEQFEVENDSD